jgi:two-component system, LytTR family, sensor histidine kinase AgrC
VKKEINTRKATAFSVGANGVQLAAALALAVLLAAGTEASLPVKGAVVLLALLTALGAAIDIKEALAARRVTQKMDVLDTTIVQMEELNRKLRSQRHDFLNHLQVVYSLMEMKEFDDASGYIEKVYGDIQSVSRVMRTGNPVINALLNAKLTACEQAGIHVVTDFSGTWKDLPIPEWEMCRILSNLIDNAEDALAGQADKQMEILLREDLRGFRFSVTNNGPAIPPGLLEKIFEPGVSTKGEGRGMGLYIVRHTMAGYGGEIRADSAGGKTSFSGFLPRAV